MDRGAAEHWKASKAIGSRAAPYNGGVHDYPMFHQGGSTNGAGKMGTFSVRDHMTAAPFVSDVLLYDRLVIPTPDPNDRSAETMEYWAKWAPEKQAECLDILKIKTEKGDGMALGVPWGATQRARFRNQMSTAVAMAAQEREPGASYYVDPFSMTAQLVKDEFSPALPKGVTKAWKVAAYNSGDTFNEDMKHMPIGPERRMAAKIAHRFLTPSESDPKHELLKRAVELANTDDFRLKRSKFYNWQESIIEENIEDEKAIEELGQLLDDYNKATQKGFNTVKEKFLFTLLPVGLSMAGAVISGSMAPLILGVAGAGIQFTRFCRFDRKPSIASGDFDAAAMIHDAQKALPLEFIPVGQQHSD